MPKYFYIEKGKETSLVDFLKISEFHHYNKGTFSTQYCTFSYVTKKDRGWIATHGEKQHETFLNLVKAVDYKIKNTKIMPPATGGKFKSNFSLYYPLLVLQGDTFEAYIDNNELILKEINHIQYKKQNISIYDSETFQIDVIKESYLKDYLKIVEEENNIIIKKFNGKISILEKSIEKHVNKIIKERAHIFLK